VSKTHPHEVWGATGWRVTPGKGSDAVDAGCGTSRATRPPCCWARPGPSTPAAAARATASAARAARVCAREKDAVAPRGGRGGGGGGRRWWAVGSRLVRRCGFSALAGSGGLWPGMAGSAWSRLGPRGESKGLAACGLLPCSFLWGEAILVLEGRKAGRLAGVAHAAEDETQ
jgi:hypothetical protein